MTNRVDLSDIGPMFYQKSRRLVMSIPSKVTEIMRVRLLSLGIFGIGKIFTLPPDVGEWFGFCLLDLLGRGCL